MMARVRYMLQSMLQMEKIRDLEFVKTCDELILGFHLPHLHPHRCPAIQVVMNRV